MENTFRTWHEELKLIDFIEFQEFSGKVVNRMNPELLKSLNSNNIKVGDKVHVKSVQGMYEVTKVSRTGFVITCDTWRKKFQNHQMEYMRKHIFFSDFHAFAGGRNNRNKIN